jgi:hypothetical protein
MAIYGPKVRSVGTSTRPLTANGAHNFKRDYYKSTATTGDVRGEYQDLELTSTGSGETLRIRGIASGTLTATGGVVNAIHATGRVTAAKTVGGALNAIRATLEVAGTTPTPGGTLAALNVDSNIVTGWHQGIADSFIRVTNTGAGKLTNLFCLPTPAAKSAYLTDPFVAVHADSVVTHAIAICDTAGTKYWIQCTTDTPAD